MPELAPFRALRYTAQAGPLADLVAPPYDIISPAEHAALCRRSPHNVAHLILGTRARPDGPPPDGWHAAAAAALAAWRHNGVLRADPEPAFYLYTQTFDHGGRRRARKLLLAALRLDPYEAARVLPHEEVVAPELLYTVGYRSLRFAPQKHLEPERLEELGVLHL